MQHTITADRNNQDIAVNKGDTINIVLDETPTSGYQWDVDTVDNNILSLESSGYNPSPGSAIGGGGMKVLTFVVKDKGTGRIKLKNWQRWSGDIYKGFELNISVQ
jgi:predicted secreted protein